jgi:DNA-binding phage protein
MSTRPEPDDRPRTAIEPRDWGDRDWIPRFLEALSLMPNVSSAARTAGISRAMVYLERKENPEFRAAWDEAVDVGVDLLEQVAHTRATTGEARRVLRTITRTVDGQVVERTEWVEESVRVSDAMLTLLLKAHRPEVYRERVDHRHVGPGDGPIEIEVNRRPTRERILELVRIAGELEPQEQQGELGPGG